MEKQKNRKYWVFDKHSRPIDCIINQMFIDSNDPEFCREKYCKENCNFKCLGGLGYKKITAGLNPAGVDNDCKFNSR